ncbi:MAG: usher protein [Xanthomonadaceae bacterium]|nr:usher protein [Xanthomonadaceae bacterium]
MARCKASRSPSSNAALGAKCGRRLLWVAMLMGAQSVAHAHPREDWYLAAHNHQETGLSVLLVTLDDGTPWIRVSDLKLLGLHVPATPAVRHQGEDIVPVASLDVEVDVDPIGNRIYLLDRTVPVAGAHPDNGNAEADAADEVVVDLVVNRQPVSEPQLLRRHGEHFWLSADALSAARLRLPVHAGANADWVPLAEIAGDHYVWDERHLRLEMTAPAARFQSTQIPAGKPSDAEPTAVMQAPLAGIIGYNTVAGRRADGSQWSSFLLDAGVSKGNTACRSRHVWRSAQSSARLDTNCVVDWPEQRLSVTFGDAISRDSALSGAVRYGGIRIGTDFGLQPYLRTQPLLDVEGSARLPSVLEVWLRQQLALRTEIPPGAFLVQGLPVLSGSGDINAVVTDVLGRQVVLSAPFYSDPALLRPGLTDWSLEIGRQRVGFAGPLDAYTDPFALFSLRRGISSYLTVATRIEKQQDHALLELDSYFKLGTFGVLELAAAQSKGQVAGGRAYAAGYSYQGQRWNLGLRYTRHEQTYADLAYPVLGTAPLKDAQLGLGVRLGRMSLSAGGVMRETQLSGRQSFARTALNFPLAGGYFSLSGFRPMQPSGDALYTAMYTLPLSAGRTASAWVNREGGMNNPGASLQRSAPAGLGYGYRVAYEDAPSGARSSLDATLQESASQLDLGIAHSAAGTDAHVGARGAVIATRDGLFASTDDGGSFAIVSFPQADAHIRRDHQYVASTNKAGKAVVPRLRAFERNRLDVDVEGLDVTTHISDLSMELVPGRRQVVRADFGASRTQPLSMRLSGVDGVTVPAGAVATVYPQGTSTPVGHDGLLYLELAAPPDRIEVQWPSGHCVVPGNALQDFTDAGKVYVTTCETIHAK